MIEEYFQSLLKVIAASPIVFTSDISFDKRSSYVGLIRGNVYFADDSLLHLRELVDLRSAVTRSMYVYHYQGAGGSFVFRYDNTKHFPGLPNFPHHKHVGDEANVIPANGPALAEVIEEIESLLGIS